MERPEGPAAEDDYCLLGTRLTVRIEQGAAAAAVGRLLGPFRAAPAAGPAHRYSLTASELRRDGEVILRPGSQAAVLRGLLADVNRVAVDGFGGLAVHAGVVARGEMVVAFPAPSGAGKSTLTAACLSAGFGYVSDEALCVDFDRDAVQPYPKPMSLSLRSAGLVGLDPPGDENEEMFVLPEDLGAAVATGPLRLRHVVRLVRRPGPPGLHPLDRSETVAALLAMSFNHYRNPLRCFQLAGRLAAASRAWQLGYDDPRPAAALLHTLPDR